MGQTRQRRHGVAHRATLDAGALIDCHHLPRADSSDHPEAVPATGSRFVVAHQVSGGAGGVFAAYQLHHLALHGHEPTARVGHFQSAGGTPDAKAAGPNRQALRPVRFHDPKATVVELEPTFKLSERMWTAQAVPWEKDARAGPGIVQTTTSQ
jgi:hypothetical protein